MSEPDSMPPAAPIHGGALILAAGASRRFGEDDKRRALLADGRPLLQATLARYRQTFEHVHLVLRPADADLAEELVHHGVISPSEITRSARANRGMGFSLADGVRALPDWDFVVVGLGDMPRVTTSTLASIARALRGHLTQDPAGLHIVQPVHNDVPGNPVGFSRALFAFLAQLEGDQGARQMIQANRAALDRLSVSDPGIHLDVDTPDALAQLNGLPAAARPEPGNTSH